MPGKAVQFLLVYIKIMHASSVYKRLIVVAHIYNLSTWRQEDHEFEVSLVT
jgi:hypothetical protein